MPNGYGQATVNKQHVTAHRAAYFIANGEWPEVARHKCDNRQCANPDHIENGSAADNKADYTNRSLANKGEEHKWAKLTDGEVVEVKRQLALGTQGKVIAREFNVSRSLISQIKLGKARRMR